LLGCLGKFSQEGKEMRYTNVVAVLYIYVCKG